MSEHLRPAVCPRPLSVTRCPFCHDEVRGRGIRCGGCGARQHTDCVDEWPSCAACGYDLKDELPRALLRDAAERDPWWARWTPSLRWQQEWARWRRFVIPPLVLLGVAAGIGLTLALHALLQRLF